jgi:hypothetical protein
MLTRGKVWGRKWELHRQQKHTVNRCRALTLVMVH